MKWLYVPRTGSGAEVKPDLGPNHDELAERAYLNRQMDARRRAEELLESKKIQKKWDSGF